jgi:hypothetical protein
MFCALIETSGSVERLAFFKECFSLVTNLLWQIVDLPDVGKLRTVRQVTNDESHEGEDAIYGSISDDLAGIWGILSTACWCWKKMMPQMQSANGGSPSSFIGDLIKPPTYSGLSSHLHSRKN